MRFTVALNSYPSPKLVSRPAPFKTVGSELFLSGLSLLFVANQGYSVKMLHQENSCYSRTFVSEWQTIFADGDGSNAGELKNQIRNFKSLQSSLINQVF